VSFLSQQPNKRSDRQNAMYEHHRNRQRAIPEMKAQKHYKTQNGGDTKDHDGAGNVARPVCFVYGNDNVWMR